MLKRFVATLLLFSVVFSCFAQEVSQAATSSASSDIDQIADGLTNMADRWDLLEMQLEQSTKDLETYRSLLPTLKQSLDQMQKTYADMQRSYEQSQKKLGKWKIASLALGGALLVSITALIVGN